MENLIIVLNPEKAEELSNLGFKYILQAINGQTAYGFFISEEIMQYVNSHFAKTDFLLHNRLIF